MKIRPFYELTSKRRKGFPSETRVGKGRRIVHGDKELEEKLGRMDPSGRTHLNVLCRDAQESQEVRVVPRGIELFAANSAFFGLFWPE